MYTRVSIVVKSNNKNGVFSLWRAHYTVQSILIPNPTAPTDIGLAIYFGVERELILHFAPYYYYYKLIEDWTNERKTWLSRWNIYERWMVWHQHKSALHLFKRKVDSYRRVIYDNLNHLAYTSKCHRIVHSYWRVKSKYSYQPPNRFRVDRTFFSFAPIESD